MLKDPRKTAEDFIEKVIVPRREAGKPDATAVRARAKLAREELELAHAELAKGGLDPKRLDALAAERSKIRKKLVEEDRRTAAGASAAAAARLRDIAPVILPVDPVDTMINEVTFVRGFAGQGRVLESNVGPGENWARYRLDSSTDTQPYPGRLSFFTLWQNKQDISTVLMARANLVVNAHLSCEADGNGVGSWFGATSQARATVRARTTVWNMDSSISSIVSDEVITERVARGNFWGDDSADSIEFNELLPASGVSIAPNAYSLIEVELLTDWQELSGSVVLDAESGSHRVDLPQLVLTTVNTMPPPPPISLAASVSYSTSPATVTFVWNGATTPQVDIYENAVKRSTTMNDGVTSLQIAPGTYDFKICESGSSVCSNDVTVNVTQ